MSNVTNIKAILLRLNSDHNIRCSAAQEKTLVRELDRLWQASELSRSKVAHVISQLPTSFFADNRLDSSSQYAGLLWDALSVDAKELQSTNPASVTHFHGPVHAQILQTGARSNALINQRSQQNESYGEAMASALKHLRGIIDAEIIDEGDRNQVKKLISDAELENSKTIPDKSKVQKYLGSLGKWTGERFTKAVDAAIGVGIKYGMTGTP